MDEKVLLRTVGAPPVLEQNAMAKPNNNSTSTQKSVPAPAAPTAPVVEVKKISTTAAAPMPVDAAAPKPAAAVSAAPTAPAQLQGAPRAEPKAGPTSEQIASRAYEIFQARGGEDGRHHDDWLQAERELKLGKQ